VSDNHLTISDRRLIKEILRGNEKALRKLYLYYSPKLRNFINQRVSDPKDAEEILQDTLIASLEALRDFTGDATLYTYICAIAKYKTIDYYRKKKLKRIVFSKIPAIERIYSLAKTPEDKLDEIITKEKVQEVLDKLRPKYSTALKLKYLKGFSVEQVAQKMGISFKATESILFRARKEFALVYDKRSALSKTPKPT
jgi:RNA polymerase sigma-70 factor, ECF subfamily